MTIADTRHSLYGTSNSSFLAPPMERGPSSMSTDSTNTSAASIIGSTVCGQDGCLIEFHGRYQRGNLARHRRMHHNGPVVFECLDPLCGRVFRRSDARLKHCRKYHPEFVVDRPFVAKCAQKSGALGRHDVEYDNACTGSQFADASI